MNEARSIISKLEIMCFECATQEYEDYKNGNYLRESTKKHFDKLKKSNISDIVGRYADDLYNDKNFLMDVIGDEVYGKNNSLEILKDLVKINPFPAMKSAVNNLIAEGI